MIIIQIPKFKIRTKWFHSLTMSRELLALFRYKICRLITSHKVVSDHSVDGTTNHFCSAMSCSISNPNILPILERDVCPSILIMPTTAFSNAEIFSGLLVTPLYDWAMNFIVYGIYPIISSDIALLFSMTLLRRWSNVSSIISFYQHLSFEVLTSNS